MERVNLTGEGSDTLNICPVAHTSKMDSLILDRKYISDFIAGVLLTTMFRKHAFNQVKQSINLLSATKGGGL